MSRYYDVRYLCKGRLSPVTIRAYGNTEASAERRAFSELIRTVGREKAIEARHLTTKFVKP